MKLRIAGIDYDVQYVSSEELNGLLGTADFNAQKIRINKNATDATQHIAVIHEIIHILDKSYNIKLSEEQVVYLAQAIVALVKENPDFIL
jgi:hypothetical protein